MRLKTYNTGLAHHFTPFSESRTIHVANHVAESDANVMCLQEVWAPDDLKAILARAKDGNLQHAVIGGLHADNTTDTLSIDLRNEGYEAAVDRFFQQVRAHNDESAGDSAACGGAWWNPMSDQNKTKAAYAICSSSFNPLESFSKCMLGAAYAMGDVSDACKICVSNQMTHLNSADPFDVCMSSSVARSHHGHNGLVLLSDKPLDRPHVKDLESFIIRHAALKAEYDDDAVMVCTHLTTDMSMASFDNKDAAHFEQENLGQVRDIVAMLDDPAHRGKMHVVMGDLNSSDDKFPGSLAHMRAQGFSTGDTSHISCTYNCADNAFLPHENPLTKLAPSLFETAPSRKYDHIFVRNGTATNATRLFMDKAWLHLGSGQCRNDRGERGDHVEVAGAASRAECEAAANEHPNATAYEWRDGSTDAPLCRVFQDHITSTTREPGHACYHSFHVSDHYGMRADVVA